MQTDKPDQNLATHRFDAVVLDLDGVIARTANLPSDGVEVYASTIAFICALCEIDKRTAVVTSKRNCQAVLEATGMADLFDERVGGSDLRRLGLTARLTPGMFAEACSRLGCEPARSIGVVDLRTGVQAAKTAGLGFVIGVNHARRMRDPFSHGADMVVEDLADLHLIIGPADRHYAGPLCSALDGLAQIIPSGAQEMALFLDYDSILSRFASHPGDVRLTHSMRTVLQRLSGLCELAVISDLDLTDVRERIGIKAICYAGSQGFEIAGPLGVRATYREVIDYLPALKQAERSLRDGLQAVEGCVVERKRFSLLIHTCQLSAADLTEVERFVEQVHTEHPRLRLSRGELRFELQPALAWDKGKALRWLMQSLDMDPVRFVPIYLGDGVNDEAAFREVTEDGVGILVGSRVQSTRATYRLADSAALESFLERLADLLERSG
jgi:alpha,alpha-trehalase